MLENLNKYIPFLAPPPPSLLLKSSKKISLLPFAVIVFICLFSFLLANTNENDESSSLDSAVRYTMGDNVHFAGDVGFILLTDREFTSVYNWFVNVNVYGRIFDNLYLGGEISYAKFSFYYYYYSYPYYYLINSFILPFELNVKYSLSALSFLGFDFGGGPSITYIDYSISSNWLFGFQIFINMNFIFDSVFFGLNTKYQLIQDVSLIPISPSNFRVGFHVGGLF